MFKENGKRFFVVQLFPLTGNPDAGVIHKQKLDCAMQLARSVALDFNNALTSILGHTSLILSKMEPGNPWRASLLEVEKSASRAAEIANDLGTFSRQEKENKSQLPGNLNLLIQRSVQMFQSAKQEKQVVWSLKLERKLNTVNVDEAKMQQALVNILNNSIEALGSQGEISLLTRNLDLTEPTSDRNARLNPGTYVCVEITDTGCGIEPSMLPRVFEPFFTTKKGTKHRGLGLAWVYGIVTNHGGGVAISSQPGSGTSVRVYMPATKKQVKETVEEGGNLGGTETILIVDDDEQILNMGKTILSSYGYKVITSNSGQQALEIIAKGDREISLVITDMVMPKMSGRELVEQVAKVAPQLRVICSSGYVRPGLDSDNNTGYLQKPFTSINLLQKVRQTLSRNSSGLVD
jgi:nitrogen-specific signal transduction histidine kinase/CheY-like chemotaxis protein